MLAVEFLFGRIFGFLLFWSFHFFDLVCLFLPWSVIVRQFLGTLAHRGVPLLVYAEVELFPVVPWKVSDIIFTIKGSPCVS